MNKILGSLLWLTLTSGLIPCAFAAPDNTVRAKVMPMKDFEAAKDTALKDYDSAKVKIEADDLAAMVECARRTGPTAAACKIQAQAKDDAAGKDAKVVLDRATETFSLPDNERKKTSDDARVRAKADYGVAKVRITSADRAARTVCSTLRRNARAACKADVSARTTAAEAQAKYLYTRDRARAKSIAPPSQHS